MLVLINSEELVIMTSGKAFDMLLYVLYYLQGQVHNCKYHLTFAFKVFPKVCYDGKAAYADF